ncbi:MAG: hypothetical protein A2252_02755 [Elusimicrobia bacterium RIFOXYA2_FULL_39_19]|nr:MAG: hypothetical protein A2252_02755 [Elusimicrobia bacterium RIFOXYA2_FULL_39_19]
MKKRKKEVKKPGNGLKSKKVAELKKYHKMLLHAAQEWRDTFDTISALLCLISPEGKIIRCNRAMKDYLKMEFNEILGNKIQNLLYKDTEAKNKCPFKSGKVSAKRETGTCSIGSRYYFISIDPLLDKNGKLVAAVYIASDITSQLWPVEELKKANSFLDSVLNNSLTISIISTDKNHKISFWNKGAEIIFGFTATEIIGRNIDELYSTDADTRQKVEIFRQDLENRKSRTFEIQQICKNGKKVWINLTVAPRVDENNQLIGALGIGEDITERKNSETENVDLVEQLRQAQKMEALGKFAGGIAHDFNNFLTVIKGYAELLIKNAPDNDQQKKDLGEILTSAQNASLLTQQLLAFSKKQVVNTEIIDLNDVISSMEKTLQPLLIKDLNLVFNLNPKIPRVKVDKGQIIQVIMNMAINARDAMENGGRLIIKTDFVLLNENECKIMPESLPGEFVRMSIEDNGSGMAPDVLAHIFEPFFTTKDPGKGTGLGLSVVYGIVKHHNGWINAYSEPGHGAVFHIYLPSVFSGQPETAAIVTTTEEYQGNGENILLVEDDPMVLKFADRLLTNSGYKIISSSGFSEALELFRQEKKDINIVFSDVILKDGSGTKLAAELLAIKPDLKILLTSGYLQDSAKLDAINSLKVEFIQKPYTEIDLLKMLKKIVSNE